MKNVSVTGMKWMALVLSALVLLIFPAAVAAEEDEVKIVAVLRGLEDLYVGVHAEGELRFELEGAVYMPEIVPGDFRVFMLPAGLQAGEARRVNDSLVVIPISGAPMWVNDNPTVISVMPFLPARNILRGIVPIEIENTTFQLPRVFPSAALWQRQAVFDLNPANAAQHRDITINLTIPEGEDWRAVSYGTYRLIEGIDYLRITNHHFRIYASFLRQLPVGEWPLTFNMRLGANPEFMLTIVDTRIEEEEETEPGMHLYLRLPEPPELSDLLVHMSGGVTQPIDMTSLGADWWRVRPPIVNNQASIWLRADVLEYLAWRFPNAVLEMQTRFGTWRFPTNLLDILRDAKTAIAVERLDYDQVYVRITVSDLSATMPLEHVQALSPLVDLKVELLRRATMEVFFTVLEFTRPIDWMMTMMPQSEFVRAAAFWFNTALSRMEFAPHRVLSANEMRIRSIFTGTHGVLHNGATPQDMDMSHWGFEHAYTATYTGLVQAAGGNIVPHAPITRAEFAQLLSFALQLPAPGYLNGFYLDVPEGSWIRDPIARAWSAGLLDGEEFFRPAAPITRQEMITMAAAAITRFQPVQTPVHRPLAMNFTDHMDIAQHHRLSVQTGLDYGLFVGFPDATFRPNAAATRIEAIVIIVRLTRVMGHIE